MGCVYGKPISDAHRESTEIQVKRQIDQSPESVSPQRIEESQIVKDSTTIIKVTNDVIENSNVSPPPLTKKGSSIRDLLLSVESNTNKQTNLPDLEVVSYASESGLSPIAGETISTFENLNSESKKVVEVIKIVKEDAVKGEAKKEQSEKIIKDIRQDQNEKDEKDSFFKGSFGEDAHVESFSGCFTSEQESEVREREEEEKEAEKKAEKEAEKEEEKGEEKEEEKEEEDEENEHGELEKVPSWKSRKVTKKQNSFKNLAKDTTVAGIQEDEEGEKVKVNQYLVLEKLGQGAFGMVYKVGEEEGGDEIHFYAMKEVSKKRLSRKKIGKFGQSNALALLKSEIAVWKKVLHENCLRLLEVIDDPDADSLFMISELIEGGASLPDTLICEPLPLAMAQNVFYQLICGLEFLHENKIIHHDIKPSNILLTDDGVVKIADFGLAELLPVEDDSALTQSSNGTAAFLSPQMVAGDDNLFSGYDADLWACGVSLYMFVYGYVPFRSTNIEKLYKVIQEDDVVFDVVTDPETKATYTIDENLKDLINKMLSKKVEDRLTISEIKQHPWLASIHSVKSKKIRRGASMNIRKELTKADIDAAFSLRKLDFLSTIKLKRNSKRMSNTMLNKITMRKSKEATDATKELLSLNAFHEGEEEEKEEEEEEES